MEFEERLWSYLTLLSIIFKCLGVVLCVPFLTLFERKILSYIQSRKGPKKISIFGLLQPIVDGVKLIIKEAGGTLFRKKFIYHFSTIIVFFLRLRRIFILTGSFNSWVFKKKFLFFLAIISCNIFPLFFSGLSSKRKYSILGSFRGAAQVIAYEVKAVVFLLLIFSCLDSFKRLIISSENKFLIILVPASFIIWLFCIVAETNRAPFDFAEGERELVSGYKTEYRGLNFTLLFLAEYRKIIIMRICTSIIFFRNLILGSLFIIFFFMLLRASFPRLRYDLLMIFRWKIILPLILVLFAFSIKF